MSAIIPDRESMTVEFKSDASPIGDDELLAAVVCMANADGAPYTWASRIVDELPD